MSPREADGELGLTEIHAPLERQTPQTLSAAAP